MYPKMIQKCQQNQSKTNPKMISKCVQNDSRIASKCIKNDFKMLRNGLKVAEK